MTPSSRIIDVRFLIHPDVKDESDALSEAQQVLWEAEREVKFRKLELEAAQQRFFEAVLRLCPPE